MKLWALVVLLVYCWSYNSYFGHNWMPKSGEEAICDGIAVLGYILILMGVQND